jgi:hypothetical protein
MPFSSASLRLCANKLLVVCAHPIKESDSRRGAETQRREKDFFTRRPLSIRRIGGKVRGDGAFPFVTIV